MGYFQETKYQNGFPQYFCIIFLRHLSSRNHPHYRTDSGIIFNHFHRFLDPSKTRKLIQFINSIEELIKLQVLKDQSVHLKI